MIAQIKDGGPAYPTFREHDEIGMSLRDYFAAHAPGAVQTMEISDNAQWRYEYADAMLKAREAKP